MLAMDRHNLFAPGWSHVLSTTGDVAELEAFRVRIGAPPAALHLREGHRPHLDLRGEARARALAEPGVRVFERTADLLRFLRAAASPGTA
jgi:hypothetical protein